MDTNAINEISTWKDNIFKPVLDSWPARKLMRSEE